MSTLEIRGLTAEVAGKPVSAPPYRYRLDLQEILARRPAGVVLASFITLLLGCTVFVAGASVSTMMFVIADTAPLAVAQFVAFVLVLGGSILMARGLVDELEYNDVGNEVRLVKYFPARSHLVDDPTRQQLAESNA